MAFTTFGQETEWALFLQPRSPHGATTGICMTWQWQCITSFSLMLRHPWSRDINSKQPVKIRLKHILWRPKLKWPGK